MAYKKKYKINRASKEDIEVRYLTAPLGSKMVRGFIPHSVHPEDDASEVADLYGIHPATARLWLRILRGPQISRNGRIVTRYEKPAFGSPTKKRKSS